MSAAGWFILGMIVGPAVWFASMLTWAICMDWIEDRRVINTGTSPDA